MKVSQILRDMKPYKPGKPISETRREFGLDRVIKLASNENPLGPSPKAIEAIQKHIKDLHLYPDPTQYDLLETFSKLWSLPKNRLSFGNGSDELIDLLTRIFCEPGDGVLATESAFAAYEVSAQANRALIQKAPLKPGFKTDLKALSDFFFSHPEKKIRLIFLANPNNPTGTYIPEAELREFLKKFQDQEDVMIVIDEAYTEFVRAKDYPNAFQMAAEFKNVIVLRTFSKILGLAGLRLGAMYAPEETIEIFNRVRKPFNINNLASVAAIAAAQDGKFIQESREITWKGLDYFYKRLKELGLPFIESQGNFVLFDTLRDAQKVFQALLKRGVIMRPVGNYGLPQHLRLSVGLPEENEMAMKALEEVLKEIPQ